MAILASAIITSARGILLDPSPGDWFTDAELLALLNFAERKVLLVRPELYPARKTISMVAGNSQSLAAGDTVLLDIFNNVVSKRRATPTSRAMLENLNNFWPNDTATVEVQHWTHDPRTKRMFDVYPPNDGTGALNALVGSTPTPLAATSDAIHLEDIYESVLLYYVLSEAFSANSVKQDLQKSTFYEGRANALLGVNGSASAALAPKLGAPGGA